MSRRQTPWHRGFRSRTPRGLLSKFVPALLVVAALSLLFGAAANPSTADDTPPLVTYTIDGILGTNGWYRASINGNYVVVHWTVSDPDSSITAAAGCEPAVRIDDPNTGTTRTCSATSAGGTTAVTTKAIKVDADPPTGVAATPNRGPDANGWYNHALSVAWSGSDATS